MSLNSLIQRVEAIGDSLAISEWNADVFPALLCMEQVNATVLDENRTLNEAEREAIQTALSALESAIERFRWP